jgi:hypothetical protein
MIEEDPCIKCGVEIKDNGIIYIRAQVMSKWGNHPICTQCWDKENPGREAYKVKWNEEPDD